MTGAGEIKVDQGETHGNHQEGLNGGQVATEKQTGRVVNCREMSDGRRIRADVGVYIKALSKTEEKTTSCVGVRRAGNVGAQATVREGEN
jgi:hypothetical protein